ncbi:MAG TPA: tRNA (adenosine(37)-N6)-threonylcarbamoyltransferase complex dimerization subunit type 1 TsaB [Actinomycetes bacterium]|jgi:tRNA threonylcarbamoyladenosine biosynthesis protein TsaB|nr:tRNA (adenosine(37)-N6)-threonylcarbamoyltransferase complex dimerization subunit type 1 TsaB [Actinomycetes bacterium]
MPPSFVIGIDTATPVTSVAAGSEAGVLAAMSVRNDRAHAELLVPMVREVLERSGLDHTALAGIAVGTGPGLFTGLRVGVSSAKALAQAWRLPIVAVPSLDLLAFACRQAERLVCAVIDGRRGELFAATYRPTGAGVRRASDHRVLRPDALADELEALGEPVLLCGEGALRYSATFERLGKARLAGVDRAAPSAESAVQLALPRLERGEVTPPLEVRPLYLRRPDVDPSIERRLAAERLISHRPRGAVGAAITET